MKKYYALIPLVLLLFLTMVGCKPSMTDNVNSNNISSMESLVTNNSSYQESDVSSNLISSDSSEIGDESSDIAYSDTVSIGIGDNVFVDDWEFWL